MISVLHLGIEPTWRGGENQIRLLIEGTPGSSEIKHHVAYPLKSEGHRRFKEISPTCPLPSPSPFNPRSIFKLKRYCQANQVKILNAHSSASQSLALNVMMLLPDLKLVVHRRVDNPISTNFLTRKKYMSPKVTQYVAISAAIGNILENYGVSPDKISVVPSSFQPASPKQLDGTDAKLTLREKLKLDPNQFLVGLACAFTEQKGVDVLIRAASEVYKNTEGISFAIAGEGPLESGLRELGNELDLGNGIQFLPYQSDILSYLSALDLLAMPSNNEGLGTLLLDASQLGLPICATRVGGIPEVVIHEKTGLLCEKGDYEALAANILRLYQNPGLRASLGNEARKHCIENFSTQKMVSDNLAIYQSLSGST